jgi:rfaE bifunctional protein kinase chain/domain
VTSEVSPKIVDEATLESEVRKLQSQGYKAVHCHGGFHILHPGHIRHLKWAKSQGKVLTVGVVTDHAGRSMEPHQIPAAVRAENLAHLEFVDYVHIYDGEVSQLLSRLRPDIYVKGSEFRDANGAFREERAAVEAYGGEIRFSSGDVVYEPIQSQSLDRIAPLDSSARAFCARHGIDTRRMRSVIQGIEGQQVLVVGETIIDEYVHCDPLGMSSDSPTVVVRPTESELFLGGAGIVAQHVAAMGAKPVFFSVVGQDVQADFARAELERRDIDYRLVVDSSRPTIHKKRFLSSGKKLLNVNSFRDQDIDAKTAGRLCDAITSRKAGISAVIISDFSYGVLSPPVLETVLEVARAEDIPVVGDVQCSSQIGQVTRLKGLTAATPSEREARLALWDRESGLADLGVKLLDETRHRALVLTLGARGLMILDTEGHDWEDIAVPPQMHAIKKKLLIEYLPAFGGNVIDAMGAGDAMLSAFTAALSAGASIMEAAYLGNCASAIEIGHMGNIPVAARDLLEAVQFQLGS